MESNIGYYIALLAVIIIGFLVVKKIASCLIKSIVTLLLVAVAVAIYWLYLR
ncbi:MAG: sulfate transporter [Prevotella sp.]|nr:sulfate transporter [Prevotella sp.]